MPPASSDNSGRPLEADRPPRTGVSPGQVVRACNPMAPVAPRKATESTTGSECPPGRRFKRSFLRKKERCHENANPEFPVEFETGWSREETRRLSRRAGPAGIHVRQIVGRGRTRI